METNENQSSSVSRRDLLKKGAVAGGIVWAAPVVMSGTAGAASAPGSPAEIGCTTFYRAKWERDQSDADWLACTTGVGSQDCLGTVDVDYTDACPVVLPAQGPPQPLSDGRYVIYVPQYINGAEVLNVQGATKGGSGTVAERCAIVSGDLLSLEESQELGYTTRVWEVVFPARAPSGGLSHVEITFCT